MPQVGRILVGTAGAWDGTPEPTLSYLWEHCDVSPAVPIPHAINRTYELASGDVGHRLCLLVMAKNSAGTSQATSSPTGVVKVGSPLDRSAPTISGRAQVGQTLTAHPGVWAGSAPFRYVYQWRRCDRTGANCGPRFTGPRASPSYVVGPADRGHTLVVYVTASNSAGRSSVNSRPSAVVTRGHPGSPPKKRSSARIHAQLLKALVASGRGATIGALLEHRGYPLSFSAPLPGRLVIAWYHRAPHGKQILVAGANVVFRRAGTLGVKLALTRNGRRLLAGARQLKLTAKGRFTPVGKGTVGASRSLTLKT